MHVDEYSTTELINELKLHAQSFDHKIDPVRDLLLIAAERLRQYQWMDSQRVIQALATVKKVSSYG
jgi:hypothetical protein